MDVLVNDNRNWCLLIAGDEDSGPAERVRVGMHTETLFPRDYGVWSVFVCRPCRSWPSLTPAGAEVGGWSYSSTNSGLCDGTRCYPATPQSERACVFIYGISRGGWGSAEGWH